MRQVILVLTLVVAAAMGTGIWHGLRFLAETPGRPTEVLVFEVRPGVGFNQVSRELAELGVVKSDRFFRWAARALGYSQRLKVGEYSLHMGMTPREVMAVLVSGRSIESPITIPEGHNIYEIGDLLAQRGLITKASFIEMVQNPGLIRELLGENHVSLEGYLFPETYMVSKFTEAKTLVRQMVENFKKVSAALGFKPTNSMSRHQWVTLASVIEKETGAPEERPLISSVFHNRLAKGMRLQSDPTIIYGMWRRSGEMPTNIRKADILAPSAYNTYTIPALPVGPIANPGREALAAVIRPEKSPYLYFVSRNDGTHVFTSTYEDHQKAVRKFQLDRKARENKSWRDLNTRRSR